jgi:hypothetical protein
MDIMDNFSIVDRRFVMEYTASLNYRVNHCTIIGTSDLNLNMIFTWITNWATA